MQTLPQLVLSARNGDQRAYDQIVFQFQTGLCSLLGDFQGAEDAAQEALMEAFCCLPSLREPLAFPGWLRRIIFKHCDRLTFFASQGRSPLKGGSGQGKQARVLMAEEFHLRRGSFSVSFL